MGRKIIIKMEDLNREINSFLTEIGTGMPICWNGEAVNFIRNGVVKAFEKMGVTLEIDERSPFHLSSLPQQP